MKGITYLCALWFALTGYTASAQNDTAFLSKATGALNRQPAAERVYLHLDKPNYGFGDTIWYKAYTVIGQHHQLSALSGVLYVELTGPQDTVIIRQILHLTSGTAWGDIPLAHTLKQGVYHVRAYTNWMRNAGPGCFYDQRIGLGAILPGNAMKQAVTINPDVQFFPEGGQLVEGIRSRVAIKALGDNGLGTDIKGTIQDNEGNVVVDFATQHLGMGVFALVPQSGKTYRAVIKIPGEATFAVDLPKAQQQGYVLTLNNSQKDSVFIKVAVNDKTFSNQKDSTFYIIAQNSGKIYYTSQGKLESLVYSAKVEKNRFPRGITQFTLFSESGAPLAERIVFIQSADTLKLNLNAVGQNYTTRQKVKINLDARDNNNKLIAGSFSVAVINEGASGSDENSQSTIINNLLLTSELKGHIEQPNYYFTNSNQQKQADLDVLMLTQGYRRFEWKRVLNDSIPAIKYAPQSLLQISGVLKGPTGKPIPNGKIALIVNKENILRDTTADMNGNFEFTGLYLPDTSTVVLRARKQNNGGNVNIQLTQAEYPPPVKTYHEKLAINYLTAQEVDIGQKNYAAFQQLKKLDSLKNNIQLKQVDIKGYIHKKPDLPHSSNLNGPGNANQIIMGDAVGGCISVADCLNGKIPGVTVKNGLFYNDRRGKLTSAANAMVIIIDGAVIRGDSRPLDNMSASDIYSIEVLRSGAYLAMYGSNAGNGALVITTRRGGEEKKDYDISTTGLISFHFKGFTFPRAFYVPKYTVTGTDAKKDLRSTVYWDPNIITDKGGKASIEYFNNDTKGTYRVVIEGIDDEGNLGRAVYRYSVQ